MSEAYLIDLTTYAVLFEFDCDTKELRRGPTTWTDKPVEDGANLSDYGFNPPEPFRVEGIITAWPITGGHLPLRVSQADAALRRLRKALQPVGLVTRWWAEEVVIDNAEASQSQGEGEALRVTIECHVPRIAAQQYAQVAAARLKAAVKKRAAPAAAKGGAAAGKKTDKDWIYKIKDAIGGVFG